jgi:hypothetical protein
VPEDRLRATLWGAATLTPLSVLAAGFITQYVEGPVGLVLNLVCLFLNGLGVCLWPALLVEPRLESLTG